MKKNTDKVRFSKYSFMSLLDKKIEQMEQEFHFDPDKGFSQVENKSKDINRHFGEYTSLIDLREELQ